jgi:transcriptional regulator with XRE-family HTH domain
MTLEARHRDLRQLRASLGLSQEGLARILDVAGRTVERWEAGFVPSSAAALRLLDQLDEIAALGREVYGDDLRRFMATPRRSLGLRTPTAALMRGEIGEVLSVLAQAAEGQWG